MASNDTNYSLGPATTAHLLQTACYYEYEGPFCHRSLNKNAALGRIQTGCVALGNRRNQRSFVPEMGITDTKPSTALGYEVTCNLDSTGASCSVSSVFFFLL